MSRELDTASGGQLPPMTDPYRVAAAARRESIRIEIARSVLTTIQKLVAGFLPSDHQERTVNEMFGDSTIQDLINTGTDMIIRQLADGPGSEATP